MPHLVLTRHLQRYLDASPRVVAGGTVRAVLEAAFQQQPALRGYLVDDQDRLRQHITIFIDGQMIRDRQHLSDLVGPDQEVFVMQALSGG